MISFLLCLLFAYATVGVIFCAIIVTVIGLRTCYVQAGSWYKLAVVTVWFTVGWPYHIKQIARMPLPGEKRDGNVVKFTRRDK